eukprot:7555057-Pyramimonas_sp.AAC.1
MVFSSEAPPAKTTVQPSRARRRPSGRRGGQSAIPTCWAVECMQYHWDLDETTAKHMVCTVLAIEGLWYFQAKPALLTSIPAKQPNSDV